MPFVSTFILVFALVMVSACGPSGSPLRVDAGDDFDKVQDDSPACTEGDTRCSGNTHQTCQYGAWIPMQECADACDATRGCVQCVPGSSVCAGEVAHTCRDDGSGYDELTCDPLQGLACSPQTGRCEGACAPHELGHNYIGCEYFPTVTANDVDNDFDFAVVVSNTTKAAAQVHITGGALPQPVALAVPPGRVAVQTLPWHPTLKACTSNGKLECGKVTEPSALVPRGAYHLRSTQPVTVYQFNPLNYELDNNCTCNPTCSNCSFTNDASLLLPANVMTGNYYVASYPVWSGALGNSPSVLSITATSDETEVTIMSKAHTSSGQDVPALEPGMPQSIRMNRGDAVQFLAHSGDFTGSTVSASKPVQVIGAHYCTQIPFGMVACDHIEESMFPQETLGRTYLVTAPAVPALPDGKDQTVRIIATEPSTTLSYEPPLPNAPATIASAGDFVEIPGTAESFMVSANRRIMVVQYMQGQQTGGNTGDPAMSLAIPVAQYRTSYQFHAPVNYEVNYVNITAPMAATILLDDTPVPQLELIGTTGMGLVRVQLSNSGNGDHVITGDQPFGISVYGYGQYTSYWYPGGLDLAPIVIQ